MNNTPPVTSREIWGWGLYDFANSAFATSILAVIFNRYFAEQLAGGEDGVVLDLFSITLRVPGVTFFTYTLAAATTRRLAAGDDPPRWHRLFWAFALTVLPLTLMLIGGLRVMQTAVLVVSLPILVVGVCMSVALVKQLAADALTGRP